MNAAEHFRNIFNILGLIFFSIGFDAFTTLLLAKFMINKFAILATPKKKNYKKANI